MRKLRPLFVLIAMMMTIASASAGPTALAQESTPADPPAEQTTGTIEIHGRLCDETPTDISWFDACHDSPLAGQVMTATNTQTQETIEGTTDEAGNVVLTVPAGEYEIAGIPGEFLEDSFIYCSTMDSPANDIGYPVAVGAEQPSVICDYYAVPADLSGEIDVSVHVNLCIAPGCTELPEAIEPAEGVEVTLSDVDDGSELGTCASAGGMCVVEGVTGLTGTTPVSVMVNPNTIPDGYFVEPNPSIYEIVPETPEVWLLLYPVDGFPEEATPTATVEDEPVPLPVPLALELPASIYDGTCADLEASTSAEPLNDLTIVDGDHTGSADALVSASGYTPMAMSMSDFVNGEYAIAAMDEDQNVIACGDVGGPLDQQDSLAIGLAPVDESGAAGVAYIVPLNESETGVTVFLVPEGLIPEPDIEIQPVSTPIG